MVVNTRMIIDHMFALKKIFFPENTGCQYGSMSSLFRHHLAYLTQNKSQKIKNRKIDSFPSFMFSSDNYSATPGID